MDVLTHAGIKTEWWDNNTGDKHVADRIQKTDFFKSDDPRFCHGGECLDQILIDGLDAWLDKVDGEIHWLKIDVEGAELQVLQGWHGSRRPWVLVVESTLPMSQEQNHETWDGLVVEKGYTFAYFDGLNRFYVSDAHPELAAAFGQHASHVAPAAADQANQLARLVGGDPATDTQQDAFIGQSHLLLLFRLTLTGRLR